MMSEDSRSAAPNRRWTWVEWTAAAALVSIVGMLLAYVLVFYRPYFNSDDAGISILADEIWRQGRLLPSGWINNNGDLMMPSGALVIAPLLHWFPNGYAAHSAASVFAIAFSLGSLAWLLAVMRMPPLVNLFVTAIFAAGVSYDFTFMLYAQTTYVWWSAGFCLGAALICRRRLRPEARRGPQWVRCIPMLLLVFCISFSNPGRVALMMVAPLYLLDRALAFGTPSASGRRIRSLLGLDDVFVLVGIGAAFAFAFGLYLLLAYVGVTHVANNAAALRWAGWDGVIRHVSTFSGWFYFLGANVSPGERNPTGFAWIGWFRWVIAVGATVYACYAIASLAHTRDNARRAFAIALLGAFVPIFVLYALFDPLAQSYGTLRYFIVPMTLLFVLAAFVLRDGIARFPRAGRLAVLAGVVLLMPIALQRFVPLSPVPPSPKEAVAAALRDAGLKWGYATWWNAQVTTVLSDGVVRVNPANLVGQFVSPFGYIVSKEWYKPDAWEGETFLLLGQGEATSSRIAALRTSLGQPLRTLDVQGYRALIYDYNISRKFACSPDTLVMESPMRRDEPLPSLTDASLRIAGDQPGVRLVDVRVRNDANVPISGYGRYPISIGVQLLRDDGTAAKRDWVHTPLPCPVAPGDDMAVTIPLPDLPPGRWKARVDLVVENVAWLGDWGRATVSIALDEGS